jgi:hypothetical protein
LSTGLDVSSVAIFSFVSLQDTFLRSYTASRMNYLHFSPQAPRGSPSHPLDPTPLATIMASNTNEEDEIDYDEIEQVQETKDDENNYVKK